VTESANKAHTRGLLDGMIRRVRDFAREVQTVEQLAAEHPNTGGEDVVKSFQDAEAELRQMTVDALLKMLDAMYAMGAETTRRAD